MSVTKRSDKFEDVAHAGFFVSIEDSSEVPQVWRLRSEGSWTSHNGSSVNFLGDGAIFWGGRHENSSVFGGSRRVSRAIPLERGSTRHTTTWRGFRKRSRRDGNGVRNGPA